MLSKPITQRSLKNKTQLIFFLKASNFSGINNPSTQTHYNHHHHHNQNWSRRQDEESRNVKVSVWWDFENCGLPNGVNVFKVANNITSALRAHGIKGPVCITAFGDVLQLSRANQEALSCTGINLAHVPHGGKNSADRSLLVDLMYWVSQNPPPAHLFLVSGDRDFASTLHRLRMNNYNILLASPEHSNGVLCSAASIMWQWHALLKGENFIGKHFNQPPDGPYNSWYGHSKIPLEDPYSSTEQSASRVEELPDTSSDTKLRPIPKAVIKHLRQILSSHPNGISITDLRHELTQNNVLIDKDFYGHKKFSRFLLSMPHILGIKYEGHGRFIVRAVPAKNHESTTFSKSPMPAKSNFTSRSLESAGSSSGLALGSFRDDRQDQSEAVDLDAKQALPPPPGTKGGDILKKTSECLKERQDLSSTSKIIAESAGSIQLPADKKDKQGKEETEHNATEVGFLRKFLLRWFSNDDGNNMREKPGDVNDLNASSKSSCKDQKSTLEGHNAVGESPSKTKADTKSIEPRHSSASPGCSLVAASTDKLHQENKADTTADANVGLFGKIIKWFNFWGRDQDTNKLSSTAKHDIFSQESFWSDIETFLETPTGSTLVLRSETRGQMADNLRKEGPSILRSFNTNDISHLVDLLITEKKWVEECPTCTPSFKLTRPAVESSSEQPHQSNVLDKSSQPDMQKLPDCGGVKDIPRKRVSAPFTIRKPLERSRMEVLADCRRLVNQVLKEHPEGYNIGSFRKLFLERYNYPLDVQKLGYQKLASLLQIMAGVRVESTYIIPSGKMSKKAGSRKPLPDIKQDDISPFISDSDADSSDAMKKNVDLDSPWEELGPVAKGSEGMELEPLTNKKAIGVTERQTPHVYEPSLSDDDEFSDTEPETSAESESDRERNSRLNEEDSSLLQILDSWYSSKEGGDTRKRKTEKVDGAQEVLQVSQFGEGGFKSFTEHDGNGKLTTETVDGMIDCSNDGLEISGRDEICNSKKLKTEKADGILDSSRNDLETPNSVEVAAKSGTALGNIPKKHKPPKKEYLFVSDPMDGKKDKLIDGILDSLKKSGESGMHS